MRFMKITEERLRVLRANSAALHAETVACIKNALLTLMEQKNYGDIKMTDIINKSGVSRAGVYYNYKSKNEILLDICEDPIKEAVSGFTDSIFNNMEVTFRIGKKHETSIKTVIAAGLEQEFLRRMNKLFENRPDYFYYALWNGMIFNSFFEWARAGMPGSVEDAIADVNAALKQVAASIDSGLRNNTPLSGQATPNP